MNWDFDRAVTGSCQSSILGAKVMRFLYTPKYIHVFYGLILILLFFEFVYFAIFIFGEAETLKTLVQ